MSFEVFVQCYGKTEESGLSRDRVRSLFPVSEEETEFNRWVIRYSDADWFDIYASAQGEPLRHFMVSRPTGNKQLWEALLAVLQMGDVVMFWPGSSPMIASTSSPDGLPEDMIKSLGEPVFISRAEQFFELLKSS